MGCLRLIYYRQTSIEVRLKSQAKSLAGNCLAHARALTSYDRDNKNKMAIEIKPFAAGDLRPHRCDPLPERRIILKCWRMVRP